MKVLVINSGSSSIKYQLFDMSEAQVLASGAIERIGEPQGVHRHRQTGSIPNHREGLALIGKVLRETGALGDLSELSAIGHRVVHGGEYFRQPTVIDNEVLERIRDMIPLAPLHNPANVMGIEVALQAAPHTPDEEFEIALQTKACVS